MHHLFISGLKRNGFSFKAISLLTLFKTFLNTCCSNKYVNSDVFNPLYILSFTLFNRAYTKSWSIKISTVA